MSAEIVPIVPTGDLTGNTKQISPARNWCLTLNNWKRDELDDLLLFCSNSAKFYIIAEECGKLKETPHLQGYIELKSKGRPCDNPILSKRISWRIRGKYANREHNIEYIKKEYGTYYTQGQRVDALRLISDFRPWQQYIYDIVRFPCTDDRTIYWLWESEGNFGKTSLSKFLCVKHHALVLSNKACDMKHGIVAYTEKHVAPPQTIICDIPRSVDVDYLSYTGLEEVKNGIFFSPKFKSEMFIMNSPHMVVFSNDMPNTRKLSADRWKIFNIRELNESLVRDGLPPAHASRGSPSASGLPEHTECATPSAHSAPAESKEIPAEFIINDNVFDFDSD